MSYIECMITGKSSTRGNNVAHCNLKKRRNFKANLHRKRLWSEKLGRYIRPLLSTKGLKFIDKHGVDFAIEVIKANGYKV